jgi:hypothetical protein
MTRLIALAGFFFCSALLGGGQTAGAPDKEDLIVAGFQNPPRSARPQTWWHWMNGHLDRAALVRDLEAMQRVGLGGVQIFNVNCRIPAGPVKFNSPEWRDLFKLVAAECDRLGLELSLHSCDGWSQSGGPWVSPADAMQKVVTTEVRLRGPTRFDGRLPTPASNLGYYRDIAVVAFPPPPGDELPPAARPLQITTSVPRLPPLPPDTEADWFVFPSPKPEGPIEVRFSFEAPLTCRALTITQRHADGVESGELQVSDDGREFRPVCPLPAPTDGYSFTHTTTAGFTPVSGRVFRVLIKAGRREPLVACRLELHSGARLDRWEAKAGDVARPFSNAASPFAVERAATLPSARLLDLTGRLSGDGRLAWDVPPGDWTVLRLGHTPTGRKNAEATAEGSGPEVDKMAAAKVRAHFDAFIGSLIAEVGPLAGRSFKTAHLDSWEALCANWTPAMPAEFLARRGYSLEPFLPVLTGRVVESVETSERFLWDYRRTIADLIAENHFGTMRAELNRRGLRLQAEALGPNLITIGDAFQCKAEVDTPMAEFWTGRDTAPDCKEAASSAHLHGKTVVPAEAFTAVTGNWTEHPYSLKATGDRAFCRGINQFFFHRFAHNPWPERAPGMTMGRYGINFEPTATWWTFAPAWIDYLARCQFLLRQGVAAADLLYYVGEQAPSRLEPRDALIPAVPKGYDFDGCGTGELLSLLRVRNGRLVTPSGMECRVLVLPPVTTMTPRVAAKVRALVQEGAVVVGPRPTGSPSLAGQPAADQEVRALAAAAWDQSERRHAVASGDLGAVLRQLGLAPDFEASDVAADALDFTHRRIGDSDLYFVSNQTEQTLDFRARFRVTGRQPELWDAVTGARRGAAFHPLGEDRTEVLLRLEPRASTFVFFRTPAPAAGRSGRNWDEFAALTELRGPWEVRFDPTWGGPAATEFRELTSWSVHSDPSIRYYSGTAKYVKEFVVNDLSGRLALSLGRVAVVARARLNGHDLGVLWAPPYRAEITQLVRSGTNRLEVQVANLWPNRLIGDEQRPPDCEWTPPGAIAAIPDWVRAGRPSPTGRLTFTTWRHYTAASPLLESGLLGPVRLERIAPAHLD